MATRIYWALSVRAQQPVSAIQLSALQNPPAASYIGGKPHNEVTYGLRAAGGAAAGPSAGPHATAQNGDSLISGSGGAAAGAAKDLQEVWHPVLPLHRPERQLCAGFRPYSQSSNALGSELDPRICNPLY